MAIKCSAEITATNQIDATDLIMWYYATTLTTKPLSPSTTSASITPTGWSLIEPTIASASDLSKYIYECLQIVWGDGTCSWGDVQLSASFEAAKQAYNLAHSTASIFTTFEQTHNKTLVDTVNESSSAITTLTESHQYGGINLLSNTKSIDSLSVPYTNSNISLYSDQAPIDGEFFYYCSGPKYFQIDFPTLINNQKYTLSFDISRSSNSQPVFVKIDGTETNIGTAATTWTRLSHTFIASASTTNAQIRVAFDSTSSTATYIAAIRHIKLEQGSLATPWEYSSNDISTLSNTVNTVSQTVDSNNSTISNLTQTLGTNTNGTTKTDDIVHQVSDISQDLNGITTRVGKTEIALKGNYAVSSTAKGTANKQATISPTLANYELVQGAAITVKFATENTAANPTLNINSTGAKPIKTYSGAALSENEYKWDAGSTMTFVYDGTNWCIQDSTELTRIKNNETLINQTANNVLIKATESDTTAAQGGQHLIQSLINVAPNGIKISADKVDIEGAAIFSENGYLSQDNINAINNESQTIYIQAVSGTSSISGTTTWVTNTGESVTQDAANLTPVWTLKRPIYRTKYPVLFVATQYKTIDGTITCTTPLKDDTITVIDAGHITTGTIDASNITVTNLNADNITTGTINGQRIGVGSLSLDKLAEDVYTETEVDNIVDNLQTQIDGAIETWTGTAVPTLNNAPASSWTTNAIKDTHIGDVYFVVNSQSQQNGYNYRFTKSGGTYSWQLIKDNDVTNALQRLETAEGKITSIESFDSTVSSFMTNTDSELTSVKSRATSLETRMTDAEGDISEKVDTSTFNTLSQTVDGNSASITSMSTVLTNNGLTSSTNITNTVNTVSQTASGNSSKITQLTTTLGTNADGTTKAGDVVHRTSAIEQDVSSFKTTVSETYATQTALATTNGNVTAAQTAADNAATAASNAQTTANTANNKQVAFSATSSTGATTAAKVAACTNFPALAAGVTVTVRFSTANTSTGAITLNVNSTGAKTVYVNGAATSSSNQLLWAANANVTFTYDGSYWRVDSEPRTWYGTGAVAAATAAKTVTINEVVICKGTTVVLNMTYENTSTSATLNVTSTGAKNIYYGTTTTRPTTENGYGWGAGSTVSLTFDGAYWRIGDTTALTRLTAAESTISSHTTSISQNADAIALKADSSTTYTKTDVDGLISTEVTNRNAAITAKANEITSSVSETYATKSSVNDKADASDVTALAGRVTTAESNITQNAQNIELKVSKDGVISSINQSAETVKIQASKVEIDGTAIFTAISDDVDDAITGKGYQTLSQVNSAITSKGYATTTQAQGYASTAKSEAISAAATDATTKANAAETNAKAAIPSDISELNNDSGYITSADVPTKVSELTNDANYATTSEAQGYADAVQSNLNATRSWYATSSTVAGTAVKVATITPATTDFALNVGAIVNVEFTATNTAAVANLRLNVNGTGEKPIKYMYNNARNNLPAVGYLVAGIIYQFMYDGDYWTIQNLHYNTDNNTNARQVQYYNTIKAGEALTTASIIGAHEDGLFYQMSTEGDYFILSAPLLWLTTALKVNATNYANIFLQIPDRSLASYYTSFTGGVANAIVYLVGTIDGNRFTLYGQTSATYMTCTIPTTEDGLFYIPIGKLGNQWNNNAYFNYQVSSPVSIFAFIDGKFRQVTPTEIMASQRIYYRSKVSGTVPKPTAWVTLATNQYNDTISVGNSGWSTKVTPIAASKAENVTKYLYLYTCEQRKRLDGTVECTDVTLDENTTIIDGGNIITHTVTAEQLNATSINASKTLTVGAMTDAAAETILNSNISVGGRNLLRNTGNPVASDFALTRATVADGVITITPTTSSAYAKFKVDYLDFDDYGEGEFTVSFDARAVSGATYTQLKGAMVYLGFNVPSRIGNTLSTSYDRDTSYTMESVLTYDWVRYSHTFVVPDDLTSGKATALASGSNLTVQFAMTGSYAPMQVRNVKLERGNTATDWSPAPEDVDAAISDASKTATSYVTDITGGGIMVHPSTDDDTGVQITSDVDIRQDNVSIANFGALDSNNNPTARVGKADSYHVSIDTDSLDVMNATTTLASFGSEVYIGPTNSDHILIGTMTNGNKGLSLRNISGSELEITSREFFSPWSTIPFTFNMQGTNQLVEFTGNGIEIYALGDPVESNYAKAVLKLNARIGTANQVGSFTFQTNAGSNTWSTPAGTILWSNNGWMMTSGHTANLKYNVSTCPTGIVLHFQPYTSSTVKNYNHIYHFVPKTHVASYNGTGIVVRLGNPDFSNMASKYLYISNDHITGNDQNNTTGTNSGITYNNATWVMTQVIAV